jgi:hypothetical protein
MPDGSDNLDILVICLGLVVILGGSLFGAGRARAARATPSAPGPVLPWIVGGMSALLILGCLAYFVFGGP